MKTRCEFCGHELKRGLNGVWYCKQPKCAPARNSINLPVRFDDPEYWEIWGGHSNFYSLQAEYSGWGMQ